MEMGEGEVLCLLDGCDLHPVPKDQTMGGKKLGFIFRTIVIVRCLHKRPKKGLVANKGYLMILTNIRVGSAKFNQSINQSIDQSTATKPVIR